MPSQGSTYDGYYTAHHRRPSQQSEGSVDLERGQNTSIPSPALSGAVLPAATYAQPQATRIRKRSESPAGLVQTHPTSLDERLSEEVPTDPHDFYMQYRSQVSRNGSAIRPEAVPSASEDGTHTGQKGWRRKTSLSNPRSSTERMRSSFSQESQSPYEPSTSDISAPGLPAATKSTPSLASPLRHRKSSFRDLLAKFDPSNRDEVPPLPSKPSSRTTPRAVSPSTGRAPLPFATSYSNGIRKRSFAIDAAAGQAASLQSNAQNHDDRPVEKHYAPSHARSGANVTIPVRRPLFGEIPPALAGSANAGYGIYNARTRRGSEDLPMHSPGPMFTTSSFPTAAEYMPMSPKPWNKQRTDGSVEANQAASELERPSTHRRAHSESTVPDSGAVSASDTVGPQFTSREADGSALASSSPPHNHGGSHSRIPVSTRRYSVTSESVHSSPSSKTLPRTNPSNGKLSASNTLSATPKAQRKSPSPKRIPHTPLITKPPGQRSQLATTIQAKKSSSLRANIIAPPPKISPPLRSSRPRLPVSSAAPSASHAKLVDKFATMQKYDSDKPTSGRRSERPPELNGVDLQARRLKITQALTRSRQALEFGDSRVAQGWGSDNSEGYESRHLGHRSLGSGSDSDTVGPPVIVLGRTATDDGVVHLQVQSPADDTRSQQIPTRSYGSESAIARMQTGPFYVDSPTLGHLGPSNPQRPSLLDTHNLTVAPTSEPRSAVTADTVETEGTVFESEPQSDFTRPQSNETTVLTRIMHLRSRSPGFQEGIVSSRGDRVTDDHAEEESVQIFLRNTRHVDNGLSAELRRESETQSDDCSDNRSIPEHGRSSWTSSIQEQSSEDDAQEADATMRPFESLKSPLEPNNVESRHPEDNSLSPRHFSNLDSNRSTLASDAYTIVNFVLKTSGVVDDGVADYIYQRVISQQPQFEDEGAVDSRRLEQICLEEIQNYGHQQRRLIQQYSWEQHGRTRQDNLHKSASQEPEERCEKNNLEETCVVTTDSANARPAYYSHHPKASLDSAQDWAETSPSVSSWIRYATITRSQSNRRIQAPDLATSSDVDEDDRLTGFYQDDNYHHGFLELPTEVTQPTSTAIGVAAAGPGAAPPRPPSKSPPPPPVAHELSSFNPPALEETLHGQQHERRQAVQFAAPPLQVPHRLTSSSQMMTQLPLDQAASVLASAERAQISSGRPSVEGPSFQGSSPRTSPSLEQRKLKQRRHVLKELIDTEARFEKDMKVLCDIYKETACPTLSEEDVKILFGNSEQVLTFVVDFVGLLKQAAKPAYVIDRSERFHNVIYQNEAHRQPNEAASSTTPESSISQQTGLSDMEKDQMTTIGKAFELSLPKMGSVYGEYLRNHDAANKKLQSVQKAFGVPQWLDECKKGSADLTAAWDLDSLLVKPVQRVMKYPLLLSQLIEATQEDHPDLQSLKRALRDLTDLNTRINDAKKQTELLEQVFTRKRKESDVRNGLSKALGRRTEKLRQHVGMSEMFEDKEYNSLKLDYIENYGHTVIVKTDFEIYKDTLTRWVDRMCDLAAAADAWIDVSHTRHAEAESKLRQFAMLVRGIHSIALPDHLSQVQRKTVEPLEKAWRMLEGFAMDPKGLMQKRDKRLIDYARFKNMKDRGEKLDRKTSERIEQWDALNTEVKVRMRRLMALTGDLVTTSRETFVKLHLSWLDRCNRKFAATMAIPLDKIHVMDIEKDWQVDFDYQQASALTLGICNGSLLAEAVNMVSFLTPSSTLNGDESPRPSWNSSNKRSVSLNSEASHALPMEFNKRSSGSFTASPLGGFVGDYSQYAYSNGRLRATSAASGPIPHTPEIAVRNTSLAAPASSSVNSVRPGTSPGRSTGSSSHLPRLSVDAPSPSIGPLRADTPPARPGSTSTFFSAVVGTGHNLPSNRGSGIFSSAMPMSDSPMSQQPSPFGEPDRHYDVLFTAASVYEFNIDRSRREAGIPYLTYIAGEIFDVIGERGELWLARNQDDPQKQVGWIWNKHFAKLAE